MANAAKTAIVTGASRGIGAGLVEAFLKRGYNVVANSRNITKANPFEAAANVALVDGDIGDPKTAAAIVDTAVSRFGQIDVLVNNAGIFIPKPFIEYTSEDFNALVSTTLAGFLYVSQLSVKQMLRQKSGSTVNVSTTLVGHPVAGVPVAVQVMAKGALDAVTRALAMEYAKEGIRVNTVALGTDRVTRIVRLGVSVATPGDFRDHPKVADGPSELLQDVFGKDKNPSRLV